MENTTWGDGAACMNGKIVPISDAKISVLDWGLTHSDITYDVVQVWDGGFFRLGLHLERFMQSLLSSRLSVEQTSNDMRLILHRMVARSGLKRAYVAMVASRGVPLIPGTRDPRQCGNHFFAWCVPFVWVIPQDVAARGAHLHVSETVKRIPTDSVDPTIKNYMWGDFTRALFEAKDAGFDTAALLDQDGFLTEGPGFNIFAIFGNRLVTPQSGVLQGITRRTVMEIGAEQGMQVEQANLTLEALYGADEVFTATSGGGPAPVTRVNQRIFSNDAPGARTLSLVQEFARWRYRPDLREEVDYEMASVAAE